MITTLSPKELAEAIGASESSLKRWVDSGKLTASRTAGGHRRIALTEAIRFIRAAELHVVRPDRLGLPQAPHVDAADPTDSAERLFVALNAGDAPTAEAMLLNAFLDGQTVVSIFDGAVRLAMERLGELWQHREDGIFIEHRATDIMVHILNRLRSLLAAPGLDATPAVGGALSGDPYIMPTLMASLALTDAGWRAVNIGPNSPTATLVQAATHYHARLIWVSISSESPARRQHDDLHQLVARLPDRDMMVAVGGRFADRSVTTLSDRIVTVQSMAELVGFARGLISNPAA